MRRTCSSSSVVTATLKAALSATIFLAASLLRRVPDFHGILTICAGAGMRATSIGGAN